MFTHSLPFGGLEEHALLAVGELCVQLLRFLQQAFLLCLVEAVHLQVSVTVKRLPLHRLLDLRQCLFLLLLGV